MRTGFYKKNLLGCFIMIQQLMCVFIKPNTLLLCIFLFCIFLLYRTDSHVEVQIRILLKDKYKKSCQKCKHLQSHFDFLKNAYPVSLFYRNNSQAKISFCYCVSLSCFAWIYNQTITIVTQKYQQLCSISETILIGFFVLEKQLTNILDRGFLFLHNIQIVVHEYVHKIISTFKLYQINLN